MRIINKMYTKVHKLAELVHKVVLLAVDEEMTGNRSKHLECEQRSVATLV